MVMSSKKRTVQLEKQLKTSDFLTECKVLGDCLPHCENQQQQDKLKMNDFSYAHHRNEFGRQTATLKSGEAGTLRVI